MLTDGKDSDSFFVHFTIFFFPEKIKMKQVKEVHLLSLKERFKKTATYALAYILWPELSHVAAPRGIGNLVFIKFSCVQEGVHI